MRTWPSASELYLRVAKGEMTPDQAAQVLVDRDNHEQRISRVAVRAAIAVAGLVLAWVVLQ